MALIHASNTKPRIFPGKGDVAPAEIDRAQSLDPSSTLNREKVEEIGRDGVVGYIKKNPSTTYTLTQLEYGNMELFKKITNKAPATETITLSDFKTSYFDIAAYLTDDDDAFKGTLFYPKLRVGGFSIDISEPQAIIERSFDFVGENAIIWQGDNKYLIYNRHEAGSGDDDEIDLSAKEPTLDPDTPAGNNSDYFIRVTRVRGSTTTDLTYTTDYTYNETTKVLTIASIQASDVIKTYYTSSTAPDTIFTANDSDKPALLGDSVSIYLYIPASATPSSSDYIYRLQSANIDVSFDREDYREIGNKDIIARGITDSTVSVSLGRILEEATIEEVLRGKSADYGKIDVEKFTDEAALIVKVFDDNTKSTFKYGFKATGLSPTEIGGTTDVNAYLGRDVTIEGENLTITEDEDSLGV